VWVMAHAVAYPERGITTMQDTKDGVVAHCRDCGDTHPLGDRRMGDRTTECPHCGSTCYSTEATGEQTIKPHENRIRDVVHDIPGVGDMTEENIVNRYSSYYDFAAADRSELLDIRGVGEQIVDEIFNRR